MHGYTGARDLMRSWILLGFANELNEGVSQVHTTQVNILAKVNNITDSTDKENIALIKETLAKGLHRHLCHYFSMQG